MYKKCTRKLDAVDVDRFAMGLSRMDMQKPSSIHSPKFGFVSSRCFRKDNE